MSPRIEYMSIQSQKNDFDVKAYLHRKTHVRGRNMLTPSDHHLQRLKFGALQRRKKETIMNL